MSNDKFHLVIDQWVFRTAYEYYKSGNSDSESDAIKCRQVLQYILEDCHKIWDSFDFEIGRQESRPFQDWIFFRRWLTDMMANNKWKRTDKTSFSDDDFVDPDDRHYTEIALSTPDNVIVTGDGPQRDYLNGNDDINVTAWSLDECHAALTEYRDTLTD